MPVETPSIFSKIIEEHLELKRRNAELERDLPISRYANDDPFQNHPLFKTEEQARLEETMDGTEPAVDGDRGRGRRARSCAAGLDGAVIRPAARSSAGGRGRPLGPLARLRLGRLTSPDLGELAAAPEGAAAVFEDSGSSVDTAGMDAAQVRELRSWATRLEERASSEELRAAAKAIHLLADEVESLQAKLARAEPAVPAPVAASKAEETEPAAEDADPPWVEADDRLRGSFFSRVKRSFGVE